MVGLHREGNLASICNLRIAYFYGFLPLEGLNKKTHHNKKSLPYYLFTVRQQALEQRFPQTIQFV